MDASEIIEGKLKHSKNRIPGVPTEDTLLRIPHSTNTLDSWPHEYHLEVAALESGVSFLYYSSIILVSFCNV